MKLDELAERAYASHSFATKNVNRFGELATKWENLPEETRVVWRRVAQSMLQVIVRNVSAPLVETGTATDG